MATPWDEGNAAGKLGPKVAAPHALNATVLVILLEPGTYSFEPTVAAHILSGDAEGVGIATDAAGTGSAPVADVNTQAEMAALAVDVPAGAEVWVNIDGADKYVAFCKQANEPDGTMKVNRRDRGRRA